MRILSIDIETSPNLAHVWGLWNQNVGLSQLEDVTEMMCFAWKWYGTPGVGFSSTYADGKPAMVQKVHSLLDEADAVMHYNGKRFDIPHINREMLLAGLKPPAPYKQIDLLSVAKKQFRFTSNKLEHVSRQLGLKGKTPHTGFELWRRCMAGDAKAWALMERYNKQDVRLLEQAYNKLRPWIPGHPNVAVHDGVECCPACGSTKIQARGTAYTTVSAYQRFRCMKCGKWMRGKARLLGVDLREIAS